MEISAIERLAEGTKTYHGDRIYKMNTLPLCEREKPLWQELGDIREAVL